MPRIPIATYRLQFNRNLTFRQAAGVVDYLQDLGISDCYASPILMARSGSLHGYDIVDHSRLNPEIGSEEEFAAFGRTLRDRGMGMVMDLVPNHMCVADEANRWWSDVLENGPSSPFARYFDIDWAPPKTDLEAKVLLPILGEQYGQALEDEQFRLHYEDGGFLLVLPGTRLPVAPRTWPRILQPALEKLLLVLGGEHPCVLELESILTALGYLPPRTETDPEKVRERQREKEVVRKRLAALVGSAAEVAEAIGDVLKEMNGRKGDPHSFDRLEALINDQGYRPSFWRVASDEINYRRFFDINELAAIRVEEPAVFSTVHGMALRWVGEGCVTGLRVDHVDGLLDPEKYLIDLQNACGAALKLPEAGREPRPFFIVVEKILGKDEELPEWPVHGTTGYEFAARVGGLFVVPNGIRKLRHVHQRFTEQSARFPDVLYESKKLVLQAAMSSELTVLARKLDRISEQHRSSRDFTFNSLQEALGEVIACFPVYRTYVGAGVEIVREQDRRRIDTAVRAAKRRNPATSASIFDFVRSVLLCETSSVFSPAERVERCDFILRFQQLTSPVMAKGLEDTAFYRYFPLASLNEVGGDADSLGCSVDEFHRANIERQRRFPHALSATSTHDTKRSEDVRARINVLSEIPAEWEEAIKRWRKKNSPHRRDTAAGDVPDPNVEYLFYQTLMGAWPIGGLEAEPGFSARMQRYMEKALREAKVHTSWISPNEEFERAMSGFVEAVLDPACNGAFLADFARFHAPIARAGFWNSLSQTLLKIASPGTPDFFQGSEIWNLTLVDPDNRRPVDFEAFRVLLASLREGEAGSGSRWAVDLLAHPGDGRIKLFVTSRGLAFRRDRRELCETGTYLPLAAGGPRARHIVAFGRASAGEAAICVTARFFIELNGGGPLPVGEEVWEDTTLDLGGLQASRYRDRFTGKIVTAGGSGGGRALRVSEVLNSLPVALLEAVS